MLLFAGAVDVNDRSSLRVGGSTSFKNNRVGLDGGEKRALTTVFNLTLRSDRLQIWSLRTSTNLSANCCCIIFNTDGDSKGGVKQGQCCSHEVNVQV